MRTYCVKVCKSPYIVMGESKTQNEFKVIETWHKYSSFIANLVLVKANNPQTAKCRAMKFGYANWKLCGGGRTDARADCEKMQRIYDAKRNK